MTTMLKSLHRIKVKSPANGLQRPAEFSPHLPSYSLTSVTRWTPAAPGTNTAGLLQL